jgi:TPR repeat protein
MGLVAAQYELGNYTYYGRGGYSRSDADGAEALSSGRFAADHDNFDAASKIGKLYFYRRNLLPQDNTKAKAVLQKAYETGHSDTVYYYKGIWTQRLSVLL